MSMNPYQRRGVLLMGVAMAGAIAVFFAVDDYVEGLGEKVSVVQVAADVEACQSLTKNMLETVYKPEQSVPADALRTLEEAEDRVTASTLSEGTMLTGKDLEPEPQPVRGQFAYTILVDNETGLGGVIEPEDWVAVQATYGGDAPLGTDLVVERAQIMSVGAAGSACADVQKTFADGGEVPVTLVLSAQDRAWLGHARAFSERVTLVGLPE